MPCLLRALLPVLLVLGLSPALGSPHVAAQTDPLQATTRTVNVELILDASGSMAETLPSGETRMDAAKRILDEVIQGLPQRAGVSIGLRVYGHLGDNTEAGKPVSCRASELLIPISGVDKPALLGRIGAIQPTGWTPIAYSLEQAAADFQPGGESITNAIILVTDGEETCDPPERACEAAAALHRAGISVTTHVVGFALTPEQTEQVRCIAEQGGGQLFGADDAAGLGTAIGSALEGVGLGVTPVPPTPVAPPLPLSEVRTLAYHQLTAWSAAVNDRGEEAPILSDDGQRIAFTRAPGSMDPANPNRIFVMNADGSGEREVDAYPALCGCGSQIDISGDGARVVSSDGVQLRIADVAAGAGRELIALDSGEINAIRITADGSRVFFRIYRDTSLRNASGQSIERGIWAVNADGSGLRQLVGPSQIAPLLGVAPADVSLFGAGFGLDVSANGGQVVFGMLIAPEAGGLGQGLFAVNGDGSGLRQLLGRVGNVLGGAISGDGGTVAYVVSDLGTGLQRAGVMGFSGGAQRTLTDSTKVHPGTGANLPSGERIQLNQDGSRLLLGSTGLLYDTRDGRVLALGVGAPGYTTDPTPLVGDGLIRATMDATATRVVYLFQPYPEPYQVARLDLNPADLGGAPAITDASVTPDVILTAGGSTATVSARVSATGSLLRVSSRVLREGLPDANVPTGPLLDDGAAGGDVAANDGLFTSGIATDCCAVVGERVLRIKAEAQATDGLRHATAVDVASFAVVAELPVGGLTPTIALPDQVVTPTPTPVAGAVTPSPTVATPALTPTVAVITSPSPTTAPGTAIPAATPAVEDFTTPDPAECTTEPRTLESIAGLAGAPDQAAVDALRAAAQAPGLTVPAGTPADEVTTAAVVATIRQMTACTNAGNGLAAFALWTDDALRQIEVTAAPPPAEQGRGFRVVQVSVLPDGRAVAVWQEHGPNLTATAVQAFVLQDGRYLVDETFDLLIE